MKKLKVNAQVTAFISISEIIGFSIIGAITFLAGTTTISKILIRLLEVILLPYAFLINTSENKSRVIEDGWFNIVRNIVSFDNLPFPFNRPTVVVPFNPKVNLQENEINTISKAVSSKFCKK